MKFSQILSNDQLEKLTTARLKAYLAVVNSCRGQINWDRQEDVLMGCVKQFPNRPNDELTKDNPEWTKLHAAIKAVMANRENLNDRK